MRSTELAKVGEIENALHLLDNFLLEATKENRGDWIKIVSGHAAVLADAMGDLRRARHYYEQRIMYVPDYSFALYNLARMLLREGQVDLAERYAAKSYELSISQGTDSDRDLAEAIIKQWPEIDKRKD